MPDPTPDAPRRIPNGIKFLFAGLSGMGATCVVQPLDLLKNRMQVTIHQEHKTSLHVMRHIVQNEGFFAVYNGLSAGLLRQATYTTGKLGIYTYLFDIVASPDGTPPNFFVKLCLGLTSGAVGSFAGTPAEISLIRMTADGRLPAAERRNYKHVGEALTRIAKEEGVLKLWRGAVPTIGRGMVTSAAQLASYSQAKQFFYETGYFADNIFLHFCASMVSGLVTTAASLPVDMAKTRIQNMKITGGKPEYKGSLDVLSKVIRHEGFFSLWKGFTPYYMRVGPHTVITFIILEQLNGFYRRNVMKDFSGKGGGL